MIIANAKLQNGIFDIKTQDGKIKEIGKFDSFDIDAKGNRVVPGFIDVHIHGFHGVDSADCEFYKIGNALADEGTTSWVATLMTDTPENIERITKSDAEKGKANFLGFHLEGPYLSPEKSGAQNLSYLKKPDLEEFSRFENVKMITVAPEIEGAMDFIKNVDCTVCIGHTNCSYETALEAIDNGANCLTHTFNAMPPMLHRAPGPIGAAVEKNVYAQVICDGLHVQKPVVISLYRMFTSNRLVLISDMIRPAGMPDGVYDSGGYDVRLDNGICKIDGTQTLAGGSISMLGAVKTAVSFGIDFYEAVKMASETPAKMLGLNKGKIEQGYDADLVILDEEMNVLNTIVMGKTVYTK